jgi:hypothetical protein
MVAQALGAIGGAALCTGPQVLVCGAVGAVLVTGALVGAWWMSSSSVENADEQAGTQLDSGTAAATCATGNCTPPPDCKDKNKKVKERRDEMEKRYNDLLEDKKNLFYDHFLESNPHPDGSGSWEGHIRQYQDKQKNLRRRIQDALDGGCKVDTPDAEEWATNEPPGAPNFRWPR